MFVPPKDKLQLNAIDSDNINNIMNKDEDGVATEEDLLDCLEPQTTPTFRTHDMSYVINVGFPKVETGNTVCQISSGNLGFARGTTFVASTDIE